MKKLTKITRHARNRHKYIICHSGAVSNSINFKNLVQAMAENMTQ